MAGARLTVRVHPGARSDALEEWRRGVLHVGVVAAQLGDASDRAVTDLLAERLGVASEQIAILARDGERLQQVTVDGLDQAAVVARLEGLLSASASAGRRRRAGAVAAVLVVAVIAVVLLTAGSGSPSRTAAATTATETTATAATGDGGVPIAAPRRRSRRSEQTTRHRSPRRPAIDPGTLPQTDTRPSVRRRGFSSRMHALWRTIAGGPALDARAAFFPETAYVQLKAVGDPAGDWLDRLYADYRLDIAAAHSLLGVRAGSTRLLRTDTVAAYAHWVPPNVCDNRVGYWELPNARLVYVAGGGVRSIGIASLISWRGVWYVVHLGAVTRDSATGIVNAPSAGPGTSEPSSTC